MSVDLRRQTSLSEIFPLLRLGYSHLAYSATASSAGASVATGAAAFLPERRVRAFLAVGLAMFSLKSTNSMKHISAASPRRLPSLIIRVFALINRNNIIRYNPTPVFQKEYFSCDIKSLV